MSSSFLNQRFDLLLSPTGFIGIVVGIVLVFQAIRSRLLAWSLFSLFCFSASLAKFQDQFVSEPPPLAFPLQQMRDFGRPLAIIFLLLLLLLTFTKQASWRQSLLPTPLQYLIVVQLIIFCKTIYSGDVLFGLIAACTFFIVLLVVRNGPSRWLSDDRNFEYAVSSVALVGVIFIVVNAYQAAINIYPITFIHGRFLGTTGNPQHAAVLLASVVPCLMFLFESYQQKWKKSVTVVVLGSIYLALVMTGSRTGLLMAIPTIVFFYRNNSKALLRLVLALGLVSAFFLPAILQDGSLLGAPQADVTSRFLSTDNSRAQVWTAMWRAFSQNPVFGAPLTGDRLGFGESSWLAAGATLGLFGLVPLAIFGAACVRLISQLMALCRREPWRYLHCSTVISGIVCVLVGSFFEAFLLGNLSSALLILFIYLSLGQYLLELNKLKSYKNSNAQISRAFYSRLFT